MTKPAYTETPDDGIDVTRLVGAKLSQVDREAFARYHTRFQLACYYPSVETFRDCVEAFDAMTKPAQEAVNGAHS